jgi:hypothetical protein
MRSKCLPTWRRRSADVEAAEDLIKDRQAAHG